MKPSNSRARLTRDFQDREYRESYAEDYLYTFIASQIQVIREQRGLTQTELAQLIGTKQPQISRIENYESVGNANWELETLRKLANALDTRLRVSFETYGSLIEEAQIFSRQKLQRPTFGRDPVFLDTSLEQDTAPTEPAEMMRFRVQKWFKAGSSVDQFIRWLEGYDLPPVNPEEEPFRWLLRGLPLGAERPRIRRKFSELIVELCQKRVDVDPPSPRPDDFLFSFFSFAGGLDDPQLLAGPLSTVYERLIERNHLNVEVRDALTGALVRNQKDNRFESDWMTFLAKREHPHLPGNEYTGWAGVRRLPRSGAESDQGHPNLPVIGKSIRLLCNWLENEDDRERRIRHILVDLLELYSHEQYFAAEIIELSFAYEWPIWAQENVPSLFARWNPSEDGAERDLISIPPVLLLFSYNRETREAKLETRYAVEPMTVPIHTIERAVLDAPAGRSYNFYSNLIRGHLQIAWRGAAVGFNSKSIPKEQVQSIKRAHLATLTEAGVLPPFELVH